ncbi:MULTISPECIES: hypothetical protein [Bradyrhizobium]|uniref:Phage major capsid protein n=1 Tax=Bradyrhizobium septentrionale TaxID=1404411 RepID=A0ABZ2P9D4_9BRAD
MDEQQLQTFMAALDGLRADISKSIADVAARCDALDAKIEKKDSAGSRSGENENDMGDPDAAMRTAADSVSRGEFRHLQQRVNEMGLKTLARAPADRDAMADLQIKADAVYRALDSRRAPEPMQGESVVDYAVRLHRPLMKHSAKFKNAELAVLAGDPATFSAVLDSVRMDAYTAGMSPGDAPLFQYREIKTESPGGHRITSFVGNGTIFKQLARPVRMVTGFHNESRLGRPGSSGGAVHAN